MQNAPQGPHPCPVCGQTMIPHEVKGVALEICNEHGTWLAGDQLAQIVTRIQKETHSGSSTAKRRVRRLIRKRRAERAAKNGRNQSSLTTSLFLSIFS